MVVSCRGEHYRRPPRLVERVSGVLDKLLLELGTNVRYQGEANQRMAKDEIQLTHACGYYEQLPSHRQYGGLWNTGPAKEVSASSRSCFVVKGTRNSIT